MHPQMEQITPQRLKAWLDDSSRGQPVLLDVREAWETAICALPQALHMPMDAVPARARELDPGADTVVICHRGARSFQVGLFLEVSAFARDYSLYVRVDAGARAIDPMMATY